VKRPDDRLRILLSEGSSNSARQTLYGLGRKYVVDVIDPSRWCQCRFSSFVRRWHRCPLMAQDPAGYVAFVADLVRRKRYDVLFPTHEQAYVFSKYRDALGQHVGLAVPEFDAMRRLQSKAEFARLLGELALPTPETLVVRSRRELPSESHFPCYVKLPHGTASLGVQRVGDPGELGEAIDQFARAGLWAEGDELVIQQPAVGRQSEVSAVFQHGRLLAAASAEVLATGIGGGPALRVSADHPIVVEHVRHLGAHVNWHGPLVIEYFYDAATGQPQYMEANPRIGESFNALASGVNLCELVVHVSLGREVEAVGNATAGVKTHNGFVVLIADAYNGATRRALLRRLWHGWRGKGTYATSASEMTRPREDFGSLIPATAVSLRLLMAPRSARRLAQNTVDNYSLPGSAVATVDQLPDAASAESLDDVLAKT